MNSIIRCRLACLAVLLLLPLLLVGCVSSYEECVDNLLNFCEGLVDFYPPSAFACVLGGTGICYNAFHYATSQECTENPDQCNASFEYYQNAAVQFCEERPEECQQFFDCWVESFDTEAEE